VKKTIVILLFLSIFISSFAGCGKDEPAETTTETTAAATTEEEETTAEESTTAVSVLTDAQIIALSATGFRTYLSNLSAEDFNSYDKAALTARQFLTYIKNNSLDDIIALIIHDADDYEFDKSAYSFFKNVAVERFTMSPTSSGPDSHTVFKVTLDIRKSNSKILPAGTSRWILETDENGGVDLFRRANDTSAQLGWETSRSLADFCYEATYFLTGFKTMSDFDKLVQTANEGKIFGLIHILLINNWDDDLTLKRSEAEALAQKTFGITGIDFTKSYAYNSKDDTISVDATSWGYIPATLSCVTGSGRIRTVVIHYYSDPVYFLISKTMEYQVRINDDDSLTLLSTRLVYDSGFAPYEYL